MDTCSSMSWLSELEMEDPMFFHQFKMDSAEEFITQNIEAALGEEFQHSFSSESESSSPAVIPISANSPVASSFPAMEVSQTISDERPRKQHKPNNHSHCHNPHYASNPHEPSLFPLILSFGNSNLPSNTQRSHGDLQSTTSYQEYDAMSPEDLNFLSDVLVSSKGSSHKNQEPAPKSTQGTKRSSTKPPSHSRDHIIAERLRREKLSQQFIALSAIVPGLKKVDKTSVLGEAIKYMKQLQERVKKLEEQSAKKPVESVVIVKKSQIIVEDQGDCSSNEDFAGTSDEQLPEIEARISGMSVLLRIHCEKQKGVLVKMLTEMEKLNLIVINTSVAPFGDSALDITIIAQMENDLCIATQDLVRALRSAFR
ncbi:transcription factor bHLH18-like [Malania oleifera]|uniref:transcription factor bHLH18-like n=1 Tax=Malania oleifera TaxID=397392 RepID=UPI0025AE0F53|nr:transcription factor bHLH18-like [Malania oleifera]